jgi:hypothetical protein
MLWIHDPIKEVVGNSTESSAFCLVHKECKCVGSGETLAKKNSKEKVTKKKKSKKKKKK